MVENDRSSVKSLKQFLEVKNWKSLVDISKIPKTAVYLIDQLVNLNVEPEILRKILLSEKKSTPPNLVSIGIQCDFLEESQGQFRANHL
jgi:hypothetical protein